MIRVAREDGTFGAWQAWSATRSGLDIDLGAAPGYRAIFVQAMDAAYNISETASIAILVVDPAASAHGSDATSTAPNSAAGASKGTGAIPGSVAAPHALPGAAAAASGPSRDVRAPKLISVRSAAKSCTRVITLRISARDNVKVTRIRIANEDGRFGAWKRYRAKVSHRLTVGATKKRVTVQVADAAGNVSTSRSQRITVIRCSHRR
jgi:hypothetical protein